VRTKYSEDEHVPHIVNLVDTMPGGRCDALSVFSTLCPLATIANTVRQEVKRYYEREDEYVNSEAEDEGPDDTGLLKPDIEGSSTAEDSKAQKKKKRGGKARHKMKLQLDDDDDDDDAEDKQVSSRRDMAVMQAGAALTTFSPVCVAEKSHLVR